MCEYFHRQPLLARHHPPLAKHNIMKTEAAFLPRRASLKPRNHEVFHRNALQLRRLGPLLTAGELFQSIAAFWPANRPKLP